MNQMTPLLVRFGEHELDEANARLRCGARVVELAPKAFGVLCELARQPGRLVTKDALLDAVWGHRHVSESVLKSTVSQLRQALGDDAQAPRCIETVARRGYRFLPETATTSHAPAPPPLAPPIAPAGPGPSLVGRGRALATLRQAWERASGGERQILWVTGEPGVGKSSLVDGFVASLGGVALALGQCVEPYGAGEPYLPVLDALGGLCRQDPALPALMRSVAPTWLLQLPWLVDDAQREALQRELSGASQDRMLREMGELLDRYAQDRPLLLVTEDLHWSDGATVRLIDHLARRRTPSRLLWLGTFRPAELLAEDHPLKGVRQELRARRACQELPLEPFSEQELAEYLASRLEATAPVDEGFVRRLHAHTDGLPLFVVNVVDDLLPGPHAASGGLDLAALALERALPASLAGVIERQLDRLAPDAQALLEVASVCGAEFPVDTLADALEDAASDVASRCDRLATPQGWLVAQLAQPRPDGSLAAPFGFRHALYRQVVYQRLGASRRAALHQRVLRAQVRSRERGALVNSAELAMHAERGHDLAAAVRFLAEASGSAMGHFAPVEAARHAEHALALLGRLPDDAARLELELSLVATLGVANSQRLGVAAPETLAAFERARRICELLPSNAERTWVLNGIGWTWYARGEFAEAIALAERVLAQARADGDRAMHASACNLMGVALCNHGHQADARRWLEEGLATATAMGPALDGARFVIDPEVSMRANLMQPLAQMGLHDAAREQFELALARARVCGQPFALVLAHWCGCMLQIRLGDAALVARMASTLDDLVSRHDVAQGQGPSRWYRGWSLAQQGQPEAGHRLVMAGYESHARFGMYAGCAKVLGYAAQALALAGDLPGAVARLDEALALAHRISETLDLPWLHGLRAGFEARRGDTDAARAAWRAVLATAREQGAAGFEMEALAALCDHPAADADDLDALRECVADAPAGFDATLRDRALAVLARA
jgi:DNA-binding winged helix-turn-helix (wHTH) protein/tetratricopeptide (TPR) repeat protein